MTVQTTTFGMLNKPSRVLSVTLWVAQILLALLFGGAGYNHAFASLDTLAQMGATWALQAPIWLVRFIGIAELAGTAGIILPALTRIRPGLTPLAALGFAVIQLLAIPVHIVRSEFGVLPFNCVLLALSLFVLWGRGRKARIQPRG
ncbi:DoxX family protein [Rhodopseudomonas sp.]|uniref:DoxX family protein n=1 Tax=Rhodopseudomonas sp. TaxID=1078 RepID=UPI003B3A3BF1